MMFLSAIFWTYMYATWVVGFVLQMCAMYVAFVLYTRPKMLAAVQTILRMINTPPRRKFKYPPFTRAVLASDHDAAWCDATVACKQGETPRAIFAAVNDEKNVLFLYDAPGQRAHRVWSRSNTVTELLSPEELTALRARYIGVFV